MLSFHAGAKWCFSFQMFHFRAHLPPFWVIEDSWAIWMLKHLDTEFLWRRVEGKRQSMAGVSPERLKSGMVFRVCCFGKVDTKSKRKLKSHKPSVPETRRVDKKKIEFLDINQGQSLLCTNPRPFVFFSVVNLGFAVFGCTLRVNC